MTRMFTVKGERMTTWNVCVGCRFNCVYCCARKAAETWLRHKRQYRDGFTPKLVESKLSTSFKPGQWVFVIYMGDIFWMLFPWVERIMVTISDFPQTNFLIISKAPEVFSQWKLEIPANVVLGTTIESNRDYGVTKAPPPATRFIDLAQHPHPRKFLSVEPIMDFDLASMIQWARMINPEIIEVGADNYGNRLPEPEWWKVEALLGELRTFCPEVVEKEGLERLKGGTAK